jgi:cardiolipin synthase A/B
MLKKRKPLRSKKKVQAWQAYCRRPEALEYGNRVNLLVDAKEAYPKMLEAVDRAERTVLLDSYIFNDDAAGEMFKAALVRAAKRGVRVYLIVDAVGTLSVPEEFFDDMRRAGVHVLHYRSWAPWRRSFGILRRNHRKMLVADGRVGLAGGINIGAEWLDASEGGLGWHDIHVRVEGPAVRELSKLAMSTWHGHGNIMLDPKVFLPKTPVCGSEYVHIIGSKERKKRKVIRQSYLKAIRQAKSYIYIANAYFLPDRGFRRALRNAVRRGVDVRVMVPENGDILSVQFAVQALFGRLMRAGVRLFLWQDAVLHAKTAVIDGQWATVGSFNIDRRSWTMNLEVNVNVVGPRISNRLREVFLKDQQRCIELTFEEWKKRPLFLKMLERFFHLFRQWM